MARCASSAARRRLHRELEHGIARYLGKDDAILFAACFDANGGIFEPLLGEAGRDHLMAQSRLDHRRRPALQGQALPLRQQRHERVGDRLKEADKDGARFKLIATDGVFSMGRLCREIARNLRSRRAP